VKTSDPPRTILGSRWKFGALAPALLLGFLAAGCGGSSPNVTGRVTCDGKPVVGIISFSPKDDESSNAGQPVNADMNEDGRFQLRLPAAGKYTVVVTPRDVIAHPKPGQLAYPCDRSPQEKEIKAGDNDVTFELGKRTR
jgi:hypothetical protein